MELELRSFGRSGRTFHHRRQQLQPSRMPSIFSSDGRTPTW